MRAPERIQDLIAWGAKFDKIGGRYAFAKEAAHSRSRILRARGDATGNEMVRVLMAQARRRKKIHWLEHHFTIDLVVVNGICCGVLVLDERTQARSVIPARTVLLTTGGMGQVYARTSNPPQATGDGIAMAYRTGAMLQDMEFVQFHPTSLYLPSSPPFLLTEAIRGEGGLLRNIRGEVFMHRYHPKKELAPRDIVSRAIWAEMAATRSRYVYLDLTHLGASFIKERFPTIYSTCLRYDTDITEEWVPTSPSAHYLMGGVTTDLEGVSTIPGLFAAGEVAYTGVHGANRLASNSLLEGLVFGKRAALASIAFAGKTKKIRSVPSVRDLEGGRPGRLEDAEKLRNSLRRIMWGKVGLMRTRDSLVSALAQLSRWAEMVDRPFSLRRDIEVRSMILVGKCIAEAALWRENSVGAHFRADYPEAKGKGYRRHSQLQRGLKQEQTKKN